MSDTGTALAFLIGALGAALVAAAGHWYRARRARWAAEQDAAA